MVPTLQDGRTALHYAALNGYTDVTRFLIEKGCNINIQDDVCTTSITNSGFEKILARLCKFFFLRFLILKKLYEKNIDFLFIFTWHIFNW